MSDVIVANFALQSSNHAFSAIWKLSRVMKKAGWVKLASSDGTNKEVSGTASADKWGGNVDPLADAYPTGLDGVVAWIVLQGVTIIKVSMTSAPTGSFLRGEKVTQATSAAEGEIVGFDYDSGTGHAVILPRVGTFDNSHVVTGALSGATFTATGIETYINEVVFTKSSNLVTGSIYVQRVSNENENASRFSVLAGSAGCTATVAPGGGGTGNAFPSAGSYVACGTQTGAPAHSNWFQVSTNLGKAQLVATNATPATGVSADGTYWAMIGDAASATQAQFLGHFRLDDTEDADLDPFACFKSTGIASNNANIRVDASGTSALSAAVISQGFGSQVNAWRGWRRRGFASADTFVPLGMACLFANPLASATLLIGDNVASPETVACSYSTKRLRERIFLVSMDNTKKIRKGTVRHASMVQGGTTFDTADTKLKVFVMPGATTSIGSILLDPYDGATTPLQA